MSRPIRSRDDAAELDHAGPLDGLSDRFLLPAGLTYLDGNSLGALPRDVPGRLATMVGEEWGDGLIGSWNDARWIDLGHRVGDRIAALLGAATGDVHVGDSTSVSLFKTMVAGLRLRPDRRVLVVEESTFPTDAYVASGAADLTGAELRLATPERLLDAVDDDVALVSLTHVDFRTGAMFDLERVTREVQARGALMQWDLSHSVGAVPVDLMGAGADLAVGCTYKYLNGGPGSPAFTWVHPRWHERLRNPVPGWMGHADPFTMSLDYEPAPGVARMSSGTPPVLALSVLDAALGVFRDVSILDLRARSLSLTTLFLELLDERVAPLTDLEVITPREPARRGSQVSFRHAEAYALVSALIAEGVVGDFRDPDVARFGFAPLYVRHVDVWDAVEALVVVLAEERHRAPEHQVRRAVT